MARPIVVHADWDPDANVWVATTRDLKGLVTEAETIELLGHENEYVRSWAIFLLADGTGPSVAALRRFATMARDDHRAVAVNG